MKSGMMHFRAILIALTAYGGLTAAGMLPVADNILMASAQIGSETASLVIQQSRTQNQGTNGTVGEVVTRIVDALPTWCPDEVNTVTWNNETYTVEGPAWFTITDCPCTQVFTSDSPISSGPPKASGSPNLVKSLPKREHSEAPENGLGKPALSAPASAKPTKGPTTAARFTLTAPDGGLVAIGMALAVSVIAIAAAS